MNRQIILAGLVGLLGLSLFAETRVVKVSLPEDFALTAGSDWTTLSGGGLEWPLAPTGAPALPYQLLSLEVPTGTQVGSLTLEGEWQTLAEGITLAPIQAVYIAGEEPVRVAPDETLYAQAWPKAPCENLGITRSRGRSTLHVKVTPLRYAQGKLEALANGRLTVTLESQALVDREPGPLQVASSAWHYLLLAPASHAAAWQSYLEMRRELRPEGDFELVNADDIYAAYPFNPNNSGGAPRNPAESIHAFLRAKVATYPQDDRVYVVLGGSFVDAWSITEASDTRLQTKIPGIYAHPAVLYGQVPLTDLFYACLDLADGAYPWDSNENKTYADSAELAVSDNDYSADIVVSRIPLRSTRLSETQVIAAFTEKVRRAEAADFSGRHIYASAGGKLDSNHTAASSSFLRTEQTFFDGGLNQFDPRRPSGFVDCEVVPRRTLKTLLSKRRPVLGGNPLFPNSWGAEYATQDEAVQAFFSTERDYTEYRDHGSSTYLYGNFVTAARYLTATGLSRMIIAGFSCQTGCIDNDELTLAEAELVSENGGTVASVHNTRFGLSYIGCGTRDEDGLSSTLQYRIKQNLMDGDCDIGTAWLNSRQSYAPNAGTQQRFVLFEQLLLGDPLIALAPPVPTCAWSGETPTADLGYTTLTADAATTLASDHRVKVMQTLSLAGSGDFTFAADGGVGGAITFEADSGPHTLTLASPTSGYFPAPTNATALAITGSGITLDLGSTLPTFTSLSLDGGATHQSGNIIRGTTAGQLAALLPLDIRNTELFLATRDAFSGAPDNAALTLTNATIGFLPNPNLGLEYGLWESFAFPVTLNNSTILADATRTAAFGHSTSPGLTLTASGDSAIRTTRNGLITLFGTTSITVTPGAKLTLAAAFTPSTTASGGSLSILNQGHLRLADATGLSGEVSIQGGTLELTDLPLKNVTRLTLSGSVKLLLPKTEGNFYQILQPQGATLDLTNATVSVYATDGSEETLLNGAFTPTCAYFDTSSFLFWNAPSGTWNTTSTNTPWLLASAAAPYTPGAKAYFPDLPDTDPAVTLSEEIACDFISFGNQSSRYLFSGERLSVPSLQLATNVTFSNPVYASAGALLSGGETHFANLSTPTLTLTAGAKVSADTLGNTLTTIKALRFYPLATTGGGNTCSISELKFYHSGGELDLSKATRTEAPIATSSNWNYLYDDLYAGVNFESGFGGSERYWSVTVPDASDFSSGRYYIQFTFPADVPLPTSYHVGSTYNNQASLPPKDFRVDVSGDGISWVTISQVQDAHQPGKDFGALWMNYGNPFTTSIGTTATTVSLAAGATYTLSGAPTAHFQCEDGAILSALPGETLHLSSDCALTLPENATLHIDPTALSLAEGQSAQLITAPSHTLTHAHLAHLSAPQGYLLTLNDTGLLLTKTTALPGPYRATLSGTATWSDTPWQTDSQTDPLLWADALRNPCDDIELTLLADTTLRITSPVSFGTLRKTQLPLDEGASLGLHRLRIEKTPSATVNALTYDLSAFEQRVTLTFSPGAATVIAGKDTRLRAPGTGRLVIGPGATATLYFPAWPGTIENNGGTLRTRAPPPAPQIHFK